MENVYLKRMQTETHLCLLVYTALLYSLFLVAMLSSECLGIEMDG